MTTPKCVGTGACHTEYADVCRFHLGTDACYKEYALLKLKLKQTSATTLSSIPNTPHHHTNHTNAADKTHSKPVKDLIKKKRERQLKARAKEKAQMSSGVALPCGIIVYVAHVPCVNKTLPTFLSYKMPITRPKLACLFWHRSPSLIYHRPALTCRDCPQSCSEQARGPAAVLNGTTSLDPMSVLKSREGLGYADDLEGEAAPAARHVLLNAPTGLIHALGDEAAPAVRDAFRIKDTASQAKPSGTAAMIGIIGIIVARMPLCLGPVAPVA